MPEVDHRISQTFQGIVQLTNTLEAVHLRQCLLQQRRLVTIPRGCHKRGDYIAVAITDPVQRELWAPSATPNVQVG
jgi:hypothetical protein